MRLFIAVDIPEDSKNSINNKFKMFKDTVKQNLKWVKPENWHLTIKFLGETNRNKIDNIKNIIKDSVQYFDNFPVEFSTLNAFPALNHPKVIFVDIEKGKNKLVDIHTKIDNQLTEIGFSPEKRKYKPHLTFARCRKNTNLDILADRLKYFNSKYSINVDMQAAEIKLIKSELYRNGPIYKVIFTSNLK